MASDTKNVKLGVARITFGGVDLGYTKGGVEVEVSTETHKVQVDQFGNSDVNEFITGRNCMIRVPLAETTLDNLARVMPGATLIESGGAQGTGTIAFTAPPADGDTLTINGVVYTFKTSASASKDIEVGGTLILTLDAIIAKLNLADQPPSVQRCTYTEDGTDTLTITYDTKSVAANTFTIATSTAATISGGGLLAGGVDSKKRIDAQHGIGQSLLDLAQELILHPKANAESDTADDFIVPKAMTAGQVSFSYKLDEERIFNVEFTAYPDPDTNLLFQVGDKTA